MIAFFWSVLTRFAKTFGCLFIIAGLALAAGIFQQRAPMLRAARYHESGLLSERLSQLKSRYEESQRLIMEFKSASELPPEFAAAAFKPQFPPRAATAEDFAEIRRQLSRVAAGRDALKRFVTAHFENLLADIQQKLRAHAASLTPAPTTQTSPPVTPRVPRSDFAGLYESGLDRSAIGSRKSSLDEAKQYLGVLESSAENPENKKTLEDSITELDLLAKLLPIPASPPEPVPTPGVREPLNAEKVAARLSELRNSVRQAVLSSWALDEAYDRALQTQESEQSAFAGSDLRVRTLSERLYLEMAGAITAGFVVGAFFLLIGDWTKKSSTVVLAHWCELLKDFAASPSDVYEAVERSVEARKIPGLESKRVFWHEGGAVSPKREYLQLARERLVFEIGASQFGTGFFISFRSSEVPLIIDPLGIFLVFGAIGIFLILLVSVFGLLWGGVVLVFSLLALLFAMRTAVARGLADVDRVLMKTPLLAPLYELFLRPLTYHRIDSTAMYLKAVQEAVAEAFNGIFGERDVPLMSEIVSPPVMEGLYRR